MGHSRGEAQLIRRDIFRSFWGLLLGSIVPGYGKEKKHKGSVRESSNSDHVDVLVVGGGTAGTISAIQSALAGATTQLLELGSRLGGTMTTGGVCFPGLFHAWGQQIISGIGWDLVKKTVELHGGTFPDFNTPYPDEHHWQHQVVVNAPLYTMLAEEACMEAGVTLHYHEFPLGIEENSQGWKVEIAGPGTHRKIQCRQIIDCTGGADVAGLIGMRRLRDDDTQPGSILFKIGGDFHWGRDRLQQIYVFGADSSSSATRTKAIVDGRQKVLEELRKRRAQPGNEHMQLIHLRPETAVRESHRIVGEYQITKDDILCGRLFEDAVCFAFYPIDLHTNQGVNPLQLSEGTVPTIPLRALIPKGRRNFMVAGRSFSSDRLANSSLRVQASCMAMGQAAGAVAALAAKSKTTPLDVPNEDIRSLLSEFGAIVPERA